MEEEFLFNSMRLERPIAMVLPQDIKNRINSRGYLNAKDLCMTAGSDKFCDEYTKFSPAYSGLSFEKIDLIKVLDIEIEYFMSYFDENLHNSIYKDGEKRGKMHFHKTSLGEEIKRSFFSLKFGKIEIEEYYENYIIEIKCNFNFSEKIENSKEMVKLFLDLGYESRLIGDNQLVYVRKKLSNKKNRQAIDTGSYEPQPLPGFEKFIRDYKRKWEIDPKELTKIYKDILGKKINWTKESPLRIQVLSNKLNKDTKIDYDYLIKLFRKYNREGINKIKDSDVYRKYSLKVRYLIRNEFSYTPYTEVFEYDTVQGNKKLNNLLSL